MTQAGGMRDGKVVVFTGAGRGLGQAYAVAFAVGAWLLCPGMAARGADHGIDFGRGRRVAGD